jgi:ribonuclease D
MLRIEKEKLAGYDIIEFNGEIITISTNSDLMQIKPLLDEKRIGIDTESKPMFKKGRKQKLDLIQLATESKCFLIQIKQISEFDLIHSVLTSTNIEKLGVSLDDDIKKINEFVGCDLECYTDLAKMAKQKGIVQTGARNLTARYFKKKTF